MTRQAVQLRLWTDGEKIPDARLSEIFQTPPDAPKAFHRSTLVVGTRGVGKTTLFRYQKARHAGIAISLSLVNEFGSIAKQSHAGPLELELSPELEQLIAGKATALLAVGIA